MKRITLARLMTVLAAALLTLGSVATASAAVAGPATGPSAAARTPTPSAPSTPPSVEPTPPSVEPTAPSAQPSAPSAQPSAPSAEPSADPSADPTSAAPDPSSSDPTWPSTDGPTPPEPSGPAGGGVIQGVFTTDGGTPIAGAFVTVWTTDDFTWLGAATTDQDGAYRVTGLPTEYVKVSFQQDNLLQFAPGKLDYADAVTYPVSDDAPFTVNEQRVPVGTIQGHLTSTGGPFDYFNITAEPVDGSPSTSWYGDSTGVYSMLVPVGDYRVSFGVASTTQWAYGTADHDQAAIFSVAAGATVEVDDTLLAGGTLQGTLTDVGGAPVSDDTMVTLYRGGNYIANTWTSAGRYEFDRVLPGGYQISFTTADGDQWIKGARNQADAATFTVTEGQTTEADDRARPPSTLEGRLVDHTGAPLTGYHVDVSSVADNPSYFEATTDADGRWEVDGPLGGNYHISFSTPDYSRTQWAQGKSSEDQADVIVVKPGETKVVDDTWVPGGTLVVHAVDSTTGKPVSGVCAYAYVGINGANACTDGSDVTLTDLPPATFTYDVSPQDPDSFYLFKGNNSATVKSLQTTTATVRVDQGGKVATTVVDSTTGAPVGDTCVLLRTLGTGGLGEGEAGCVDGTAGAISTNAVAPGTYEMFANPQLPYGRQWVGATGGTGDQRAAKRIVIKAGSVTTAPAVRLDKAGTISGTVYGPDGQPARAGVSMDAWNYGLGPDWSTGTDERGHYDFDRFGPYAWPLAFTGTGPRQWSGGVADRYLAHPVKVTSGKTTTYDMRLVAGTTIHGTATTSKPFDSFRITAYNIDTGDPMGVADCYDTCTGAYSMAILGNQAVKLEYDVEYKDGTSAFAYFKTPRAVWVPKKGLKLNLRLP